MIKTLPQGVNKYFKSLWAVIESCTLMNGEREFSQSARTIEINGYGNHYTGSSWPLRPQ